MKTLRPFLLFPLLLAAIGAGAQRSYAWQNHPAAKELSKTSNGMFPEIQDAGLLAIVLVILAGLIWLVYFRTCWKEAHADEHNGRAHSLRPHTGDRREKEWLEDRRQAHTPNLGRFTKPGLQAAGGKTSDDPTTRHPRKNLP